MGAIAFSEEPKETWVVAGWAFRQVLDDTASQHPDDSELAKEFEKAKAISGLIVYILEHDVATRVTNSIRDVVRGILSRNIRSGIVGKPYGDEKTVEEYRKGLQQLLEAIPSAGISCGGGLADHN